MRTFATTFILHYFPSPLAKKLLEGFDLDACHLKKILVITFVFLSMFSNAQLSLDSKVTISAGTDLVVSDPIVINTQARLINDGRFVFNSNLENNLGNVYFSGSGQYVAIGNQDQFVEGLESPTFTNLLISKPTGNLVLNQDIYIENSLEFYQGNLDLRDNIVYLGTSGQLLNESEAASIIVSNPLSHTGYISAYANVDNETDFNPANLGLLITTTENLGLIEIRRGHQVQQGNGNQSIERYYKLSDFPPLDGINNKLSFEYFEHELNGFLEEDLVAFQKVGQAGNEWWSPLSTTINSVSNLGSIDANPYGDYITGPANSAITFLPYFTLGSKESPLPVSLLYFNVQCNEQKKEFIWATASETNSDYFLIMESNDTLDFKPIAKIQAAGESYQTKEYHYTMDGLLDNAYYLLKQVDYDGKSQIVSMVYNHCEGNNLNEISAYPNPFNGSDITLHSSTCLGESQIKIYDASGRFVSEMQCVLTAGDNVIRLKNKLIPGAYILQIQNEIMRIKQIPVFVN